MEKMDFLYKKYTLCLGCKLSAKSPTLLAVFCARFPRALSYTVVFG